METRSVISLTVLQVPGHYFYDYKKWCIAYLDCHPTLWASERVVVGVMDELEERNILPAISLSSDERGIVDTFRKSRLQGTSPEEQRTYQAEKIMKKVPVEYTPESADSVLFGVKNGKMGRNDILLLRDATGKATFVNLKLSQRSSRPDTAQQIELQVVSDRGETVKGSFPLTGKDNHIQLELPNDTDFGLYQVEW